MAAVDRNVVLISSHIPLLERLIEEAGFDVVGAAENSFNGEQLLTHFQPDVIVLENDIPGETGSDVIDRLRQAAPGARILLVVNEHWSSSDTSSLGTAGVIGRDDLINLEEKLIDLDHAIESGGGTNANERRSGRDRREHQDWSKVGWERRTAVRRAADRAATPETV